MIKHICYNDCFQFFAYIPMNKVHRFKEGSQFLTWLKPNYETNIWVGLVESGFTVSPANYLAQPVHYDPLILIC